MSSKLNRPSSVDPAVRDLTDNDEYLEQRISYTAGLSEAEITTVYDNIGASRRYQRNIGVGDASGTAPNWSGLANRTGYTIWKYPDISGYAYNANNMLYQLDERKYDLMGEALSETANTFAQGWFYDGSTYSDITSEIGTEGGTEVSLMADTDDYAYFGEDATFGGISFTDLHTFGNGYVLVFEYWNGSSWTQLLTTVNNLVDNTNNWASNGKVTFDVPGDWATTSVNSISKYYVRISTTVSPSQVAKVYQAIINDSVVSLLSLSNSQLKNKEWAWCSFQDDVYVTIPNAGNSQYEGDYYVTTSSSATNKNNYFIYNHKFRLDHEDANWLSTEPKRYVGDGSPEGVVSAATGSTYHRRDGGAGTSFYVKETGSSGNAGWTAK